MSFENINNSKNHDLKAILTTSENEAIKYIKAVFIENGIDFDRVIRFRRRSKDYLTLITPNDIDFCRIKIGTISIWFSIDTWGLSDDKRSDHRFSNVKNRNTRHWKVTLNCLEDFKTNSDLILAAYMSENISDTNIEQNLPEKYEVEDKSSIRKKGNSMINNISDYTVIDIETSSINVKEAEVIELAAVRVRNGDIVDTYSTFIQPTRPVSPKITEITGITNEMLIDAPKIEEKMPEFLEFIGNDIILGHNIVSYDSTILYDVCEKLNLQSFNNDMLDTLYYSRYCDIKVPNHKLTTLTDYFNIEHEAHRALGDCIANFKCYEKLKEKFMGKIKKEVDLSIPIILNEQYSDLSGKTIVLTGDFRMGKRNLIKAKLEELGAGVKKSVSGKTDYVIIGALGSSDWKFGEYGDKVSKAYELQKNGKPIKIIKEEEFFECLNTPA